MQRSKFFLIQIINQKSKILNFILLILSLFSHLVASEPDTLWTKTFGGDSTDQGYSVRETLDGGFILLGNTSSFGAGDKDFWLIKTDSNGDTLWTKTFGDSGYDGGNCVQETSDSGFILLGFTSSFGAGDDDFWLIKTNSNGDSLWTETFGGSDEDWGTSVQETSDGGFILMGTSYSYGAGKSILLIKTDSNGDSLWAKTFSGGDEEIENSVMETSDGGFILLGHENSDFLLIKIDSNGDSLWAKTFGGDSTDRGYSVQETTDGGFILLGKTESFGAGNSDFWLIKTDSNGDSLWSKTYGGSEWESGYSVRETSDGGFIFVGSTEANLSTDDSDILLIRTDLNGNLLWSKTFGGSEYDVGGSIQETSDGGYLLLGVTSSFGAGGQDFWLIRLEPDTATIGIQKDIHKNIFNSNDFIVSNNNRNNLISIRYTMQYPSSVNLSMYNISGKLVKTLFSEYKNKGDYSIQFKTDNISSGVYYFRLEAGGSRYTRKSVVVE